MTDIWIVEQAEGYETFYTEFHIYGAYTSLSSAVAQAKELWGKWSRNPPWPFDCEFPEVDQWDEIPDGTYQNARFSDDQVFFYFSMGYDAFKYVSITNCLLED